MSLKNKTVSGMAWTFSQQFSVQLINFIVQIILARVLLPAEFGLIAMLTVFIGIGNSLMSSGMTSSLIRTEKADNVDYSTVFFMNLGMSIVIYLIMFFCAPLISDFYKQPILTDIVRVYTISFVIGAFVGVQTTRLTKDMRFKVQMAMQIPSVVLGGILGITLAYMGFGVWSIVWMNLLQSFLFAVMHWVFSGWYPSFVFSKAKLKYHFSFGANLTIGGVLNSIFNNIFNIIIGKFFSPALLGFYSRAFSMQMFPVKNLSTALNKVTYPVFASIQNEEDKLRIVYRKLMQQVMFWIVPFMIFAGILGKPLFVMLMTEKWLPAVPYFQILCIAGMLYPLHLYNLNILKVKGRSDLVLKLNIIKKTTLVVGIIIAIPYGIMALVILQVVSSILSYVYNSYYSGRFINYSIWDQIRDIAPTFLIGGISGLVVYLSFQFGYPGLPNILQLIIGFTSGFIIYLLIASVFKFAAWKEFKDLILIKILNKTNLLMKLRNRLSKIYNSFSKGHAPGFIIVGAQKSGTTSLHNALAQHPDLIASKKKEIHYFDIEKRFKKGKRWYEQFFKNKEKEKKDSIYFETTPEYLFKDKVADRIKSAYPKMKIIIILREPVSRAFSGWNMYREFSLKEKLPQNIIDNKNQSPELKQIFKFLKADKFPDFDFFKELELKNIAINKKQPNLLRRSIYYPQVKEYIDVFGPENVMVIGFKEYIHQKIATLNNILAFLSIPESDWSFLKEVKQNARAYPVTIKPETQTELSDFFKKHNKELFDLLQRELNW